MRIGLIAPPWIPVPPPAYGGTEEVIDNLARGLTALGHDVRLFTVGESTCPVPRQWLYAVAGRADGRQRHGGSARAGCLPGAGRRRRYHPRPHRPGPRPGRAARDGPAAGGDHHPRAGTPGTAAGWPRPPGTPRSWRSRTPMPAASGPSRWRRSSTTASTWTSTSPAPGPAVTCCSSAGCPPTRACTARCGSPRAGWPLVIAARIGEPAERAYFEEQVRPLLGPDDDMLAEQPLAVRVDLMGQRGRPAQPDHLARAVRPGDGRGTGDGHAGPRRSPTARHRRSSTTAAPGTCAAARTR